MDNKLTLEIVTPYGLILSEEVDEITAVGTEGEFGVLPGHVPFITTLKIGILSYKKEMRRPMSSSTQVCRSDLREGRHSRDSAEKAEEIDVERAKAAMARAEERLRKAADVDFGRATAALERATMRIQLGGKR